MNEFEKNKARVIAKYEELITRRNVVSDTYNGIYDRYENPVLTAAHAPVIWRYDMNPATNPHFMERLGINAVLNSGASLQWQRATALLTTSASGISPCVSPTPSLTRPMFTI